MTNTERLQLAFTKSAFMAQPPGQSPIPEEYHPAVATATGAGMGGGVGLLGDINRWLKHDELEHSRNALSNLIGKEQDFNSALWARNPGAANSQQARRLQDIIDEVKSMAESRVKRLSRNPFNVLNRLLGRGAGLPVLGLGGALAGGALLRSQLPEPKTLADKAQDLVGDTKTQVGDLLAKLLQ